MMKKSYLIGSAVIGLGLVVAVGVTAAHARSGPEGMRGEGMRMMFEAFDADGDGKVTAAEIEARREARFTEIDANGDGQVSRQEFADHSAARAAARAGEMFDRLDADGDGMLGRDALEAREGRGPDAARMIARLDADGDGAITREEAEEARTAFREGREERGGGRMMKRDGHGGRWMDR